MNRAALGKSAGNSALRFVITAAQKLLPNSQFFVSTHSPFIISSVNSGFIHVLKEVDGKVVAETPFPCSKGDTYLDAVEDVLGVKQWYDPETEKLLENFRQLRNQFINGKIDFTDLEALAVKISGRSDSLREMMGKEMRQISI